MLSDLKYAFRQLGKHPGFTTAVVLILALGIGANTAIFTAIDAVLLSTLPVRNPQELAFLTDPNNHGYSTGFGTGRRALLTYDEFRYLHDHATGFSSLLAVSCWPNHPRVVIEGDGRPRPGGHPATALVSGNYFSALGVETAVGRTFGEEVDRTKGANPVVVISYAYWQGQFAGDPRVVGQRLQLGGTTSYDIIGVAQPGFAGETFGAPIDLWLPVTMQPALQPGSDLLSVEKYPVLKSMWLEVIGRRQPGVSLKKASASANAAFQQYLKAQLPAVVQNSRRDFMDQQLVLSDGDHGGSILRDQYDTPLAILMSLVALLLLVACANVANLLLARATFRQKEMAIRAAVGAGMGRIFRQLLVESLLLAVIGGGLGLVVAHWGDLGLLYLAGGNLELHSDGRILAFTLLTSLLVGTLFGVAPALRSARVDLNSVLKNTGGAVDRSRRFSMGRIFVVIQVALSLLLLISAGLFIRSLRNQVKANLGYDRYHLMTFRVSVQAAAEPPSAVPGFYDRLQGGLRSLPGVRGASYSFLGLLSGSEINLGISLVGQAPVPGLEMQAHKDSVGPGYFAATGIPIVLGRDLTAADEESGQRVGLINQTMARYFFGDANPIGRQIALTDDTLGQPYPTFMVVGVAADAKQNSVKEPPARRFYLPFFDDPGQRNYDANFFVRSVGDPASVIAAVRAQVHEIAPHLPPVDIQTIDQIAIRQLRVDGLLTDLAGCFGVLGAILAGTGIYGLMSYAVARRSREVGIRIALGATRKSVVRLILRDSLVLTGLGVAGGIPISVGAERLLNSLFFGLGWTDPVVLGATTCAMLLLAAAAAFAPAWRASRVDPVVALRTE